eukprot:CAMPEP_0204135666 /NCGR_PEP_ID=MMETSP0361-20130328/16385_1 /ASSEMBLY_ACC=CAM_ASM_000343 /TAXON_ID=268821 /ORGANISM="Scrippsiella Hangoei, Strain SHTV-5" /LENGTH=381 /DNA_ID=CAMNT_0051089063 /DNA_START=23 /DNA_END=1166 /DNA_ORIENTATION=-
MWEYSNNVSAHHVRGVATFGASPLAGTGRGGLRALKLERLVHERTAPQPWGEACADDDNDAAAEALGDEGPVLALVLGPLLEARAGPGSNGRDQAGGQERRGEKAQTPLLLQDKLRISPNDVAAHPQQLGHKVQLAGPAHVVHHQHKHNGTAQQSANGELQVPERVFCNPWPDEDARVQLHGEPTKDLFSSRRKFIPCLTSVLDARSRTARQGERVESGERCQAYQVEPKRNSGPQVVALLVGAQERPGVPWEHELLVVVEQLRRHPDGVADQPQQLGDAVNADPEEALAHSQRRPQDSAAIATKAAGKHTGAQTSTQPRSFSNQANKLTSLTEWMIQESAAMPSRASSRGSGTQTRGPTRAAPLWCGEGSWRGKRSHEAH